MTVYARVNDVTMNIVSGAAQLTIPMTVCFDDSGTAVNTAAYAYVSSPNLASISLLNAALRSAVVQYVNSNYSAMITSTDVILVSGAIALPLL